MKNLLIIFSLFFFVKVVGQSPATHSKTYALAIHGGAGTILREQMSAEKEREYRAALDSALGIGEKILSEGGTALDAVEATVRYLEDNPLFNAGKGAVFSNAGKNELDAAIMDGSTLAAGAIAGVTTIRNPISAARKAMEKSGHVLLMGKGAEQFAAENGLEIVDPSYFYTQDRWEGLQRSLRRDSIERVRDVDTLKRSSVRQPENRDDKYGTVGAVARDKHGNLAAATSTGGMTNKRFGRVGDVPIIGAGTYADNKTVAISCTGWGEYFIRLVMAKTIADRMEFGKQTLQQAATEMIMKKLPALGGDGGLIAVDAKGNIVMPFCTAGMYRGSVKEGSKREIGIFK